MKLKDILNDVDIIEIQGDTSIDITGIAYDSRKVEEGNAFVCIKGYKTDGHQFINDAVNKGASALIVEKPIESSPIDGTIIQVADSRKALSKLSCNYFDNPTSNLNVIGVTGTNGKTTFTYMVHQVLKASDEPCAVLGTISYRIGHQEYTSTNTTPESYELQKMFTEMLDKNIKSCVMEVSSHSLALNRVEDIDFDYGIFTNLTPDHLDFHSGFDDYFNSKKKLFYKTKKANIVNIDDKYGRILIENIRQLNVKCFTYGIDLKSDFQAQNVQISDRFSDFDIWYKEQCLGHLSIPIPGKFSVYNALASAAACVVSLALHLYWTLSEVQLHWVVLFAPCLCFPNLYPANAIYCFPWDVSTYCALSKFSI
ncbi:MAG: UDP-N-acetylmuramoyl-L-alanyl-D-glutamate--2,6-diaminopimelate ligase [Clostridia bacterium]|nr:UDP-N-acetylmuramoyl-L-alanyl-D-glutamate--2,6-diaminopimelate ligase [Clostridia bacterium]